MSKAGNRALGAVYRSLGTEDGKAYEAALDKSAPRPEPTEVLQKDVSKPSDDVDISDTVVSVTLTISGGAHDGLAVTGERIAPTDEVSEVSAYEVAAKSLAAKLGVSA